MAFEKKVVLAETRRVSRVRKAVVIIWTVRCGGAPYERLMRREDTIMDLVKIFSERYMKPELPEMNVGDTVRVTVRVKEGGRERNQAFEGTIIAKKHGGINESITVRRVSYNVGCEKVFPVHSPSIVSVETIRKGKVRRAKLYYIRNRVGKQAKVKEKL
jgi:large subunit ribosomal protein L19